jgi:phosphoribosylformylglycinamidine (FGAM) synthase-like amidotransferase family enzyme
MKKQTMQRGIMAVALGLALAFPLTTRAGGNIGQMIAKFEPIKSAMDLEQLKQDASVVKVCNGCKSVTLVRIERGGKGLYDIAAKKCEYCGSEDTYVAVAKQEIPFKERVKR